MNLSSSLTAQTEAIEALARLKPKQNFLLVTETDEHVQIVASATTTFYIAVVGDLFTDIKEYSSEAVDLEATIIHMVRHQPMSRWQLMRVGLSIALLGRCSHARAQCEKGM